MHFYSKHLYIPDCCGSILTHEVSVLDWNKTTAQEDSKTRGNSSTLPLLLCLLILDRMATSFTVWVSCGILSSLLLAVGAIACTEKEILLREIPSTLTRPTDCLMNCTRLTFIKKLKLQDDRNIRLKDSTEGKRATKWHSLSGGFVLCSKILTSWIAFLKWMSVALGVLFCEGRYCITTLC